MKKTVNNIIPVFLAILVLFSTFSFTVEKHYCMGSLADYSLIGNVKGCEMPMSSNDDHETEFFMKVPCCTDVLEVVEGTNTELKIAKDLSQDTIEFVTTFIISYINLFEGLPENKIPFKDHSPPLLTKDIQVLYQTFLI